jgi:transglutaminase-like putative cysteine protease/tetratricopeptide (TPR) repeat protein
MSRIILIGAFCIAFCSFSQDSYWEKIMVNDRQGALREVNQDYDKDPSIEHFLSREIIRRETGTLKPSANFMADFLKYEDGQYYLYAFWNKPFFFNSYISSGFNTETVKNVDLAYNKNYPSQSIQEALSYLKAISRRHFNDFAGYRQYNLEVSSIRNWQYCGVFENLNASGLDRIYSPETLAVSTEPFEANSNGKVNWFTPDIPLYEGYMFFSNNSEYGSGVNYAQTFFDNPQEREVVIRVGASAKFKIWLNDALVCENSLDLKTDVDSYNVKVKLPKGNNRLLIKLAEMSSFPYFIVRVTDLKGESLKDLHYSATPVDYPRLQVADINPRILTSEFESYFLDKIAQHPDDFFYRYCLFYTYMRNQKYTEAKEVIAALYEKHPKSSLLRYMMMEVYVLEDATMLEELKKNLQLEDEDYHVSMSYRFQDTEELFRMSLKDMEQFMEKYADVCQDDLITTSTRLLLASRVDEKKKMQQYLNELMTISMDRGIINLMKIYIPLYNSVLNDKAKYIKLLESANKKYYDFDLNHKLMIAYNKQEKFDKVTSMLETEMKKLDTEIDAIVELVNYLHYREKYEESMPYIDKMLGYFPYSFKAMELKGDAFLQTGRTEEAIEWYRKSLVYNSENLSLRSKIQDILGEKDLVEEYRTENVYQFIKDNRNTVKTNNYGYNILLNEAIIELFEDAGGKGRYTMAIEVTSDQGVESLKEYNLGLYGNYSIIKAELVKPGGTVVPGDRAGSSFVFTGLEPKDVIYIDYEISFCGNGRFFKDYVDFFQLNGSHPVVRCNYTLVTPADKEIYYTVVNDDVPCVRTENDGHRVYAWKMEHSDALPKDENFMPSSADVAAYLHISTIKTWEDIANWYSDLVRPQLVQNDEVAKAFHAVFPNGVDGLSEDARASSIYHYIMNNFSYSSVSFRQSGYVPQKPAKTITTKLGDCKDFSALYVTLARMAGLNADLALCLTSDNGKKVMMLPNKDFNHCIVKVMIDGKEQFLELTDKYLPYKALPTTLLGASVLEIPHMSG